MTPSNSPTVERPAAFVTHRIKNNIKVNTGKKPKTFGDTISDRACPICHTYPCTCSWGPANESLAMLNNLYEDYRLITSSYDYDLRVLQERLNDRWAAQALLEARTAELATLEAATIVSETHGEGKINGKNADSRKQQRDMLVADLHQTHPEAASMVAAIDTAKAQIGQSDAAIEGIKARLYGNQALARMIAGLATALQGCEKEALLT